MARGNVARVVRAAFAALLLLLFACDGARATGPHRQDPPPGEAGLDGGAKAGSFLRPVAGYARADFVRIAEDGFGDLMNNYAWAMGEMDGCVYVGVGRHSTWGVISGMDLPPDIAERISELVTVPTGPPGSWTFANDMRGEIWQYCSGQWERVYQAVVFPLPAHPDKFTPTEIGFRGPMVTFTDKWGEEAIYASRAAAVPPMNVLLKSTEGTAWERVRTPSLPCHGDAPPYMGTPRAMAVHNGQLYVGAGEAVTTGGGPHIWATDDPVSVAGGCLPAHNWELVADFSGLGPGTNSAVGALASFNGFLYAGVDNRDTGFQVWRSDAKSPANPVLGGWTRIVEYGAGEMHNWRAAAMDVFQDHLYVGSLTLPGVGASAEGPPGFLLPKGFEIIRVDKNDGWELVVGDYVPRVPAPGGTLPRLPLARWPGGFANPLNFYCWSMKAHGDVLYVGSFDASFFLRAIEPGELCELDLTEEEQTQLVEAFEEAIERLEELEVNEIFIEPFRKLLRVFSREQLDWGDVWEVFMQHFAGADLWKTDDGIVWMPVTLNGFDNPDNYGFRNIVGVNPLYVGTTSPNGGLEVWRAPAPVGGAVMPVNKTELVAPLAGALALLVLVSAAVGVSKRRGV